MEPQKTQIAKAIVEKRAKLEVSPFLTADNISSVQLLIRVSLPPHGLQHTRPPCPSPTPRV